MPSNNSSNLHRREPSLSHYQTTTPILKHYQVNQKILESFNHHYAEQLYQIAYFLGLQFAETALLEIPKHGYYYSSRHEKERMQSALDAVRVTTILKQELAPIVKDSDWHRVDRLAKLALEQVHQASEDQYERQRTKVEQDFRNHESFHASWIVCEPLLDSMTSILCPTSYRKPSPREEEQQPSSIESFLASLPEDRPDTIAFEERRQPSNDQSRKSSTTPSLQRADSEDTILERALFLSGLQVEQPKAPDTITTTTLQLQTISLIYHEDFEQLVHSGQLRISYANTYQGRLPGSTNGCTVIAPLMCIHHFLEHDQIPDPGLPDRAIITVIDEETPAILSELRSKLGLPAHAFLIPSDVQDYFIENGQLAQEQFINVIGGNILDDSHVTMLIEALKNCKSGVVAATFFFHEHVMAILRLQRDGSRFWYDCIDSLPLKRTIRSNNQTPEQFNASLGLSSMEEEISEAIPKTVRLRCLGEEELRACLRWYACSKFTDEDKQYINSYEWDDKQTDFDPRVFQAYLWGSN